VEPLVTEEEDTSSVTVSPIPPTIDFKITNPEMLDTSEGQMRLDFE